MTDLDRLLHLLDAYCAATGLSEARVSTLFLKGGSRVASLRAGGDMGSRTIARAIEAFSDAWPAEAAWPSDVPRPSRVPEHGTGAVPDAIGAPAAPVASFSPGDAA
jgi:hypothetical protein